MSTKYQPMSWLDPFATDFTDHSCPHLPLLLWSICLLSDPLWYIPNWLYLLVAIRVIMGLSLVPNGCRELGPVSIQNVFPCMGIINNCSNAICIICIQGSCFMFLCFEWTRIRHNYLVPCNLRFNCDFFLFCKLLAYFHSKVLNITPCTSSHKEPLILTWMNINSSIDLKLHPLGCRMKLFAPLPNFYSAVLALLSNCARHFIGQVVTCPC